MDTVDKKTRSNIMRKIRSKDSTLETSLRRALWKKGFRYRKNATNQVGKPDIINKSQKTVIFFDSCFWHGCSKHCRMPSTNQVYWIDKIERNKKRDKIVNQHYKKNGWRILRLWEHDLKKGVGKNPILKKI